MAATTHKSSYDGCAFALQVFVGRVAMIGFAAAIVGEIQTGGKGPLGQLALPIQTPVNPGLAGVCPW